MLALCSPHSVRLVRLALRHAKHNFNFTRRVHFFYVLRLPSPTFSRLQIKRKGIISNASFRFACTRFLVQTKKTHAHIILCSVVPPCASICHGIAIGGGACHHSGAPPLDVDSLSSLRMNCVCRSSTELTHIAHAVRIVDSSIFHGEVNSQRTSFLSFFALHKILVYAGTGIAHVTVSLSLFLQSTFASEFHADFRFVRVLSCATASKCRRKIDIHIPEER